MSSRLTRVDEILIGQAGVIDVVDGGREQRSHRLQGREHGLKSDYFTLQKVTYGTSIAMT